MENKIFEKSDKFKEEYCCSIIKVGEIKPIEGKDKIGFTHVNGESIVVRKDQVKEGDIMFYSSNETQLAKEFLGANNLFEGSAYELNANAGIVKPYRQVNESLKEEVQKLEKKLRKLIACSEYITSHKDLLSATETLAEREEVMTRYENSRNTIIKYMEGKLTSSSTDEEMVKAATEQMRETDAVLEDYKSRIEVNTDFIRKHVGFFNKTGRVRTIKLGGVQSMGYLFSLNELVNYNPELKDVDLEGLVGTDFDTVCGNLFVKAYVPFVPEQRHRSRDEKRNKKVERFDRMVKGEFLFHYDTSQFPKNIHLFKPDDVIDCSVKVHGTSIIIGKLHVKTPLKLPIHKWLWNKFVDITGLFKSKRITDYVVEYGNVTSSRTVIKNQYINKEVTEGYYGVDIWSEYGELIYPYLEEGMTLYGEICGFLTGANKYIQKGYDYGCNTGENFLMPYRITTTNEDGTKREWEVGEVYDWTKKLIGKHPELSEKVHPIMILYHGTLHELYPHLSLTEHWHENVLEEMRNDTKTFLMEKNEPMCNNKVPREGICIRKCNDEISECFKLKCARFLSRESKLMDDIANGNEEMSEEMEEAYA